MKKFRKLIPALALLIVSAVLMSTASYAWFSMNTQVTATGMEVTAKSNSTYLLIDNVDNASTKTTSAETKAAAFVTGGTNATNSDAVVYPVYYAAATGTMPGTADSGASLAVTAGHWYTARNRNSDNATDATLNVQDLGTSAPVAYVCTYNAWLSLSTDSEPYNGKLTLTSTVASGDAGTSVVVVLSDGTTNETLKLVNGTPYQTTNNFAVTATSSIAVTFYVYIDGTTTNVYSDYINAPNTLTGNISVVFDLG